MAKAASKTKASKGKATKTKAAPKAAKVERGTRAEVHERRLATGARVAELREEGANWTDICEELSIDGGTARFALQCFQVRPKDRIKGDDESIAAGIVAARDEQLCGWGEIMARSGLGMGTVKRIYTDATGNEANQGHHVAQARAEAKAPAKEKATNPAKAKATKAKAELKAKAVKGKAKRKASANPSQD